MTQTVTKVKPCSDDLNPPGDHTGRITQGGQKELLLQASQPVVSLMPLQGCKMRQRSGGKGKEWSFAYAHFSLSILQVFSPSWCGAADSQTEHLLNYTGMCVLDVLCSVCFLLFLVLFPTHFFLPSYTAPFEFAHKI